MAENNIWIQYGALGLLAMVVYFIVKNQQSVLQQITNTLANINARQERIIQILNDLVRRVEKLESGG